MHRRLLLLPFAAVLALGAAACGSATPVAPDDSTVLRSGVYTGVGTREGTEDGGGDGDDQQDRGGTYGGSST